MSEESKIQRPVAEPRGSEPPERARDYDMVDSEGDLECWPNLAPVLRDCGATVVVAYRAADSAALRYQIRHKWLVLIAALCGMLAVLFAILQLSTLVPLPADLVVVGETVAAVVAVVAVVFGLRAAFSGKWLLRREKAERYRLLKFGFLITPNLWSGAASEERQKRLRDQMERVEALDEEALKRWARGEGEVLEAAPPGAPASLDEAVLVDLVDYYREKRLDDQQRYYERQAGRHGFWERRTRFVPPWLFFGSILAALGHFVYDGWTEAYGEPSAHAGPDTISLALIMLAACLPVVGAAVRTLRAAHEFGRNTLRFEATSNELKRLASDLRNRAGPRARLEVLQSVEKVLEVERREWLRLMMEAEWFG